jgi:hypothetical protein
MFCQVIIDTTRYEGRVKIYTMSRACKNYARKGMTCCYSHRKFETVDCAQKNGWPNIEIAKQIISNYDSFDECSCFVNRFVKETNDKDIYKNRIAFLVTYEFVLKFKNLDFKGKEGLLNMLSIRILEAPLEIQAHYVKQMLNF